MTCAKRHNSQLKRPGPEFRSLSKSQILSIFLRNIFQRNEGRSLLLLSCLVVSDSLWLHGLQQARLPCPSLSRWVCSNLCPLNRWYHPTISSIVPFSPCPQSSPASGSFLMSQLFTSGAKVLELQLQHQFFQWIFRDDFLEILFREVKEEVWSILNTMATQCIKKCFDACWPHRWLYLLCSSTLESTYIQLMWSELLDHCHLCQCSL